MSNDKEHSFPVTFPLPQKTVESLLCCAWEGGSNYWVQCYDKRLPSKRADRKAVQYRYQAALYEGGACLMMLADGLDPRTRYELTRPKLVQGLQLLARDYPRHFSVVLAGNEDARTGDVFLQLCLLGEVVYG